MAYLFIQEAVTLFVGDMATNAGDNDKALILESMKLPMLEEITATHHAGGSFGELEIGGMGIKALSSTFKVKGWDPQSMSQFGVNGRKSLAYTAYGAVRSKVDGSLLEVKAVMRGRMTKADTDEYKRGDMIGQDYEIKEMLHYELYFNKAPKFYWDFFERRWEVDGVSQVSDLNAILRAATNVA